MTLDQLASILQKLEGGKAVHLRYEIFGELFPPGEPDDEARGRALQLALEHGCYVENRPQDQELVFVKKYAR